MTYILDLDEFVKGPKITIEGNCITTSILYNCSHGIFWDQNLHTVSIPAPFKPCIKDLHIRSYITDITSKDIRQKIKQWTTDIQNAWEDCIIKNVKKLELQIPEDTKELCLRHLNESKEAHKLEDLKIIIPEESESITVIFIGKCDIVESFYNQVYNRLRDIKETINRANKLTTGSVQLKPTEVKLLLKENKFEKLDDIAFDFKKYVVERTIELDDSNKHVLELSDWEAKCTALKDSYKDICIIDDSEDTKIIVTSTYDVIKDIITEIQSLIKEHSTDEEDINVTDEFQLRFLKLHCKDRLKELEVKYSDDRLKITFEDHSVQVQGTKDGIKNAKLDIDIIISKIQKENYNVSKPGLHLLFNEPDTVAAFLDPIDSDSRTVVAVNTANSLQSRNSNTRLKETDDEYTMRQAFEDIKRNDRKRSEKKKTEEKKTIAKPMSVQLYSAIELQFI
ncbi:Hypothetical predicted protein [Mytilus galloprovincialis]|uniref:Uncharacterized protein n=1 Tax=Mytilus galloprovincialis TaxID=29158 RepID=A0A8B6HE90_MYTGA|nr:Hypothetical predicted protein [Mytilus galloprovincialis]